MACNGCKAPKVMLVFLKQLWILCSTVSVFSRLGKKTSFQQLPSDLVPSYLYKLNTDLENQEISLEFIFDRDRGASCKFSSNNEDMALPHLIKAGLTVVVVKSGFHTFLVPSGYETGVIICRRL